MTALLSSPEQMLREFHRTFPPAAPDTPAADVSDELVAIRREIVLEEVREFLDAVETRDMPGALKEGSDVVYGVVGTVTALGLPFDDGFALVHASNMTKTPNGTGKASKGDGYQPAEPLIAALLAYASAHPPRSALRDRDERIARFRAMATRIIGPGADEATVKALVTLYDAETSTLQQRINGLVDSLAEYENAITWNIVCTSCAGMLDAAYGETRRAESAEAILTVITAIIQSGATGREELGKLVRAVWIDWALQQADAKPSWLTGWAELDDGQREADMLIGEALAAVGRAAGPETGMAVLAAIRERYGMLTTQGRHDARQ